MAAVTEEVGNEVLVMRTYLACDSGKSENCAKYVSLVGLVVDDQTEGYQSWQSLPASFSTTRNSKV